MAQADVAVVRPAYQGKFKDRFPDQRSAGILYSQERDGVKSALDIPRPTTPDHIKRFREYILPDVDQARVNYAKICDPQLQIAKELTHGITMDRSQHAAPCLNPTPLRRLENKLEQAKEQVYKSTKTKPLGKTPVPNIPSTIAVDQFTFGIQLEKGEPASAIVNPPVTYDVIEAEADKYHPMYRKSHSAFAPGEQRAFYPNGVDKAKVYGQSTQHDTNGKGVKLCVNDWHYLNMRNKGEHVVQTREDDWKEKHISQLGKPLDPNKVTRVHYVGDNHTFGVESQAATYGVREIMGNGRNEPEYSDWTRIEVKAWIRSLRHRIAQSSWRRFPEIFQAFKDQDKEERGTADLETVQKMCENFRVPLTEASVIEVFNYLDTTGNGRIPYIELCRLLDIHASFPDPNEKLQSKTSRGMGFRNSGSARIKDITSNADYGATTGLSDKYYQNFGVPSVRRDKMAPRFKSVSDHTDYGDSVPVRALLNPSMFTLRGVGEEDMEKLRPRGQIREIVVNIGLEMTSDEFETVYNTAKHFSPSNYEDMVSIGAFKKSFHNYSRDAMAQ